jgi:hypothetical protein
MNVATAAVGATIANLSPLESLINSFNTNPYFIGIMMLIMNLGGRFLAMEVTKGQEKIFQDPWVRRILIIIVIFIATRNLFVAFWLGLAVILIMSILLNETSPLFIGEAIGRKRVFQNSSTPVLTPEEADIYRKLSDKLAKVKVPDESEEKTQNHEAIENIYSKNMTYLQDIF